MMKVKSLVLLAIFVISTSANFLQDLELERISQLEQEIDGLISDIQDSKDQHAHEDELRENDEKDEDIITHISKANERSHPEGVTEVDIMPSPQQKDDVNQKRNAIKDQDKLWRWKDIAYVLDSSLDIKARKGILAAHKAISKVSCIKFHEKTPNDTYYMNYFMGSGCWSYVGLVKGFAISGQDISIGTGCHSVGICIHETLHALGFYHEQSRYDRDQFVEILWENIRNGMERNFRKLTTQNSDNLGTAYDYDGVMQYGKHSFSKNGKPTILAINNKSRALGQRNGLSEIDKVQLYRLYSCTNTNKGWSTWFSWTPCNASCISKRERYCYSDDCVGNVEDTRTCSEEECKIDGHWGKWTMWSCDALICGTGVARRTRKCDDPKAQRGGADCTGDGLQTKDCNGDCPERCTFDNIGFCYYTQPLGGWRQADRTTPSSGTGPSNDVSGTGNYVYYEATGGKEGDERALQSIVFSSNQVKCFRFNYHMYGRHMGALKILIKRDNVNMLAFYISGNQGNQWHNASFDIDAGMAFQIVVVAIRGPNYQSDIAVDNLFLQDGSCQTSTAPPTTSVTTSNPLTTSTESPPPIVTTPDPSPPEVTTSNPLTTSTESPPPIVTTPDPSPPEVTTSNPQTTYFPVVTTEEPFTTGPPIPKIEFFCNFEEDWCGFEQSLNDTINWTMQSGRTPTRSTGPNGDRTQTTGKYLYIESSGRKKGDFAVLNSQYGQLSGDDQCLELYYHMYGRRMGDLEVFSEGQDGKHLLYHVTGNQGNQWHQALIPIGGDRGSFKRLSIHAYVGGSTWSDIAIDDIFIHEGECPPGDNKSPTIMSCSFDNTLCQWETSGDFTWKTKRNPTATFWTGPSNTVDLDRGYYAYAEASKHYLEHASLTSPAMYHTDQMCLRFYYHMYGENMGALSVSIQTNYSSYVIWEMDGSQSNGWHEGMIDLPTYMAYKIKVDANIGAGVRSDFAIDDVLVSPRECKSYRNSSYFCDFSSSCDVPLVFPEPSSSKQCLITNGTESSGDGPNSFLYWSRKNCGRKTIAQLGMKLENVDPRGSCLSFDYKIKSSPFCDINIYRQYKRGNRLLKTLLKRFRDGSEDAWLSMSQTLPSAGRYPINEIQIITSINSRCTYFAVDNIKVTDGIC